MFKCIEEDTMNEEQNPNQPNIENNNIAQQPQNTQNTVIKQTYQQPYVAQSQENQASVATATTSSNYEKTKKSPPIAAQILYGLGFVGLILGGFGSVVLLFSSSNTGGSLGRLGVVMGIFLAVVSIIGFYLIHEIRHGKKWALIAYTTLIVLSLISVIFDLILGDKSNGSFILTFVVVGPLLLILWTKNRNYFS